MFRSIDWALKESVKARLRVLVRRALRKYGYPPDLQKRLLSRPCSNRPSCSPTRWRRDHSFILVWRLAFHQALHGAPAGTDSQTA